jgi:hypothetical protein
MTEQRAEPEAVTKKRRGGIPRGCLLGGLGLSAGLLTAVVVVIGLAVTWAKKAADINRAAKTAAPLQIAPYRPSKEEVARVNRSVERTFQALKLGTGEAFSYRTEELNTLLSANPLMRAAGVKSRVEIDGDRMIGQLSIPRNLVSKASGDRPDSGGGGYFNATYDVEISTSEGVLTVKFNELSLNGIAIPTTLLRRADTVIDRVSQHEQVQKILSRAKTVEIRDDVLHVVSKSAEDSNASLRLKVR